MGSLALVFLGSGLGGSARYLMGLAALNLMGPAFPYGTLAVNLVGGLLIGAVTGFGTLHGEALPPHLRLLLVTGILGGFTTFSAFTLDTVTLLERQQIATAIGYILLSVLGAMLALLLGHWLATR